MVFESIEAQYNVGILALRVFFGVDHHQDDFGLQLLRQRDAVLILDEVGFDHRLHLEDFGKISDALKIFSLAFVLI